MKKIILFIIVILPTFVFSQVKTEKYYYNEYEEITDSVSGKYLAYYIFNDTIKRSGTISITSLSGRIMSEKEYENIDRKILNGLSKTYFDNGKLKSSVSYVDNLLHGEVSTYYAAGQLKRKDYFEYNKFIQGNCYAVNGLIVTHFDFKTLAEYPGGIKELYKFIYVNTYYPDEAKRNNISGMVVVKLTINKKGEIINEEISKSVHPLLDAEALRVAKLLGNFVPGQEDGEKTSTIYNLPIQFQIDN